VTQVVGNGGGPYRNLQPDGYPAIPVLTELQRAIHDGRAFSLEADGQLTAVTPTLDFLGVTGDKQIHFDSLGGLFSQGGVRISLYEAPTVSANGTPVTPTNMNFASTNTSSMAIYSGPTITDPGTRKVSPYFPATGVGVNVSPANASVANGRVLKANTQYLFRVTDEAAVTIGYGVTFIYHESDVELGV